MQTQIESRAASPIAETINDAARRADILQRVISAISSGLALDPLLKDILEGAVELIEATHGTIGLVMERNGKAVIRTVAIHNMPEEELGAEMPAGVGLAGAVLNEGRTIRLDRYDSLDQPTLRGLSDHSVIGVPIRWGETMIGFFGIGAEKPRLFDDRDAQALESFAQYAAVAIHNANLYKASQRALDEMRLLYNTSQRIGLSDDVDGVIDAYLDQVAAGGEYVCNICLYELDENFEKTAVVVRGRWSPQGGSERLEEKYPYVYDNFDPILDAGETIVISDIRTHPDVPESLRAMQVESGRWALVMIPLMVRNQRMGLVILSHEGVHQWNEDTLSQHQAVAAQLAIAIDHRMQQTLLQERGQQLAVLQERQRLARELHDSVTQLIFSTTLIAQSISPAWKRDPVEGEKRVARLLELSQTALREMRSLLFELKSAENIQEQKEIPATLTGLERIRHYGLFGAIQLLAGDFSQEGVRVLLEADEDAKKLLGAGKGLSSIKEPMVEESLYRIAQEALNNAVKHAQAHLISIFIHADQAGALRIFIKDDGVGFDEGKHPEDPALGSGLGMGTMRERAQAAGGSLHVSSAPGRGTTIEVIIPVKEKQA
jgi:signal transduction histidine kinase